MALSVKLLLSFLVVGILGCLSINNAATNLWEIRTQPTASEGSRFYVLHNWQQAYNTKGDIPALPALSLSDIMLKTMGILKEGVSWSGVLMGQLFSRPHATALFVIDGMSSDTPMGPLSQLSFTVDQSGLTGCIDEDSALLFSGDTVASHLSKLFDGHSQTWSISASQQAAFAASVDGAYTSESQVESEANSIMNDHEEALSNLGLGEAAKKFDVESAVDATFLAELSIMKQSVEKLKDLKSLVHDGVPDVYIFTVSTLRALEEKYGAGSTKVKVAVQLVQKLIQELSRELVDIYDGEIVVQALVLEWNYPEFSKDAVELTAAYQVLQPFLSETEDEFIANLPHVNIASTSYQTTDPYLCDRLRSTLGRRFQASCPDVKMWGTPDDDRVLRAVDATQVDDDPINATNKTTIWGVAQQRSSSFPAITLIIIFLVISMGVALYAVSWMMWTIDPGRDSIIYRQVSDPTEAIRMQ